jgi:hypothetical protein
MAMTGSIRSEIQNLDADALIERAQYTTSHFSPVDPGLRSRLGKLVDTINTLDIDTPETKRRIDLQLHKLIDTRLRLAMDRARLPAITQEKIKNPIFVIGFSRTGTTLLHSLMAEDSGAIAPQWWHTHFPSPPPGEVPVVQPRLEFAARELDNLMLMAPGLLTLHPYWDKRAHALIEDEEIFTIDFHNAYPTLLYYVPALSVMIDPPDSQLAYRFHKQFLQHLQWNQPNAHVVTKGIYHQFALDELFAEYPDAQCIWPHRSPAEIHTSTMAILGTLYGAIAHWSLDLKQIGPAFVASIKASLDATLANPLLNDPRIVHVNFKELTHDPIATIRSAYAHWGRKYMPEFELRMRAWMADPANRPDRYGRYIYNPEAFGLDKDILNATFADYRKRFNLA